MIRSRTLNRKLALLASALMIAPSGAYANPLGGQVVGGQAGIAGQGTKTVTVTQGSSNAIINWNSFNIGAGEFTQFIQPSATSIALNRVIGNGGPSQIFGSLQANGRIFVVNPYGMLFGPGATVNVAGFLATSHDIKNEDFMAGRYNFNIPGRPDASIVNLGTITAANGGFAALVAPGVRNAGVITANLGQVGLASGNGFTLDFYGDKLITLQVGDQIANQVVDVATGQPLKSLVSNEGTIRANGGQVALTAVAARTVVDSVINNTGTIEANSVGTKNGMIVLGAATAADKGDGAPTQTVKVSGTLSAAGKGAGTTGGTVQITGEQIALNSAKVDVSGQAGGGSVKIGGKGLNPSTTVTIDNTSLIDASAKANGDGGNVVVWSNGATSASGTILATGGALGGNGGSVETSGQTVNFSGISVDTSAPNGNTGMWLIDPTNLVIDSQDAATISNVLAKTSVTLQTNADGSTSGPAGDRSKGPGDIDVNAAITWNSNSSLTLSAYNSINVDANITSHGGGAVTLRADNTGTGTGTVTFRHTHNGGDRDDNGNGNGGDSDHHPYANISTSGAVTIFYNPSGGYTGGNSSNIWSNPYSQFVTGGGRLTAYMLVNNLGDLQSISTNLNGIYALGRNIDATGAAKWNDGQGFVPIGQTSNGSYATFNGTFNGLGNTIDGLTIAPTSKQAGSDIGLFAANFGAITNVNLTNVTVKANPNVSGSQYVGTLVGQNFGMISDVTVTGSIVGGAGVTAGGLVGQNSGRFVFKNGEDDKGTWVPAEIDHASAGVTVTVGSSSVAGGLVGDNAGSIGHSWASGNVTSEGTGVTLGGLVGLNESDGHIWKSHASGNVTAPATSDGDGSQNVVGGLVGFNSGTVSRTRAGSENSTVTGGDGSRVGGLVGQNDGTIQRSRALGAVTGGSNSEIGGLVGDNLNIIGNSWASGNVTSAGTNVRIGGLVGFNEAGASISTSHATGNVTANPSGDANCGGCLQVMGGGLVGDNAGAVSNSWASGNVASNGIGVSLGGLVGLNEFNPSNSPNGTITNSHASGNVDASGKSNNASDCLSSNSCVQNLAGGLVGWNQGAISNSFVSGPDGQSPTVHVGSQGIAGGLVGQNDGSISQSQSNATVAGDAGVAGNQAFNQVTLLGGLVGVNFGSIDGSSATGAVGSTGVNFLEVAGLVAKNRGTISNSQASGNVAAGDFSAGGGLVGENNPGQNCGNNCGPATISNSTATGNVTVGSQGAAGGLVAINNGTVSNSQAGSPTSTVTAGDNSIVGGLVAFNSFTGVITNSTALGAVASTGPNSAVGGFVGVNGGNIDNSQAAAAVTATSDSFVGGFVGMNIGTVVDSHVVAPASVAVSSSGNLVGGFVGMNLGSIDPSTTTVTPTAPGNNIVGGFAGANFNFANANFNGLTLPAPTFPTGTISNSTTNDTQDPFIGTDRVTSGPSTPLPPIPPSILNGCNDPLCILIVALPLQQLQQLPTTTSPINTPAPFQLFTLPPPPSNQPALADLTLGSTGGTGGTGGNGGNGGNGNNRSPGPPPGPGLGRSYDEQHFSGVPPIGETRFKADEIVVQIVDTVTLEQVQSLLRQFGLTLISSEHLPNGRVLYRLGFTSGTDIRRLIAGLEHKNLIASVQPDYVFHLGQAVPPPKLQEQAPPPSDQTGSLPPANDTTGSLPPPGEGGAPDLANSGTASLESLPAGDSAQYVIDKLHLAAVHRLASGRNVTVAVVDSEIDINHPDLKGVVVDRYDATQTPSHPHVHGTGMAGAIAARSRLLGVAPGVRLIAIKAFDEQASSAEATSYQILKGLDYAIAKNARIINMSFAGPRDPMMERTLKTAHDQGIILIAAAGNAGPKSPPLYPGADPSVIAVTATDYTDKPFAMANRGKYIAVAAPGVDVMVPAPGNTYQLTTGTSVAAAHVSGVAALLVERKPTITPEEVRSDLMRTAHAMNVRGKDDLDGAGLVDPVAALSLLLPPKSNDQPPRVNPSAASVR